MTDNSFASSVLTNKGEVAIQVMSEPSSALATTDQKRAVAEVQAALAIARGCPRNELKAREKLLQACQRPSLASVAVYSYPRGGQSISGPSIRLAEAAARCFGNMTYGFREISRTDGGSECESFAWDLETNTRAVRQFNVRHIRDTRSGPVQLKDERDIYEMIANYSQRRVRACILEIVPGDIIEDAVAECDKTQRASLGDKPIKEVVKDMLEAFEKFKVNREAIEKRMGHRVDTATPAEIIGLKKIWLSIEEGFSGAKDWFDLGTTDDGADDLNEKLKKAAKKEEPKAQLQPDQPTTIPCPQLVDEESGQPMKVFLAKCEGCKDRTTCLSHEKA
jgi:hypothetical protein